MNIQETHHDTVYLKHFHFLLHYYLCTKLKAELVMVKWVERIKCIAIPSIRLVLILTRCNVLLTNIQTTVCHIKWQAFSAAISLYYLVTQCYDVSKFSKQRHFLILWRHICFSRTAAFVSVKHPADSMRHGPVVWRALYGKSDRFRAACVSV